jgi:hypothetical protein
VIFDKQSWQQFGAGFSFFDCTISAATRFWFLAYEKTGSPHRDPLPRIRFLSVDTKQPMDNRFYYSEYGEFGFARLVFGKTPNVEVVAVDTGSNCYSYDSQGDRVEAQHPWKLPATDLAAIVSNVVRVGSTIYTVGGPRKVHRRSGVGTWVDLTDKIPVPKAFVDMDATMADYYWKDLSGFSESEMYAVGGAGDVWRFDGTKWTQQAFPSNERLNNVVCAADGKVYIGGNMGSLYVGRDNTWKKISEGSYSVPWKDVVWFHGKLWCGSDYGLWELRGSELIRANIPADAQLTAGAIDISPDGQHMLTAGPDGASLFDGKTWQVLFSRHDLED